MTEFANITPTIIAPSMTTGTAKASKKSPTFLRPKEGLSESARRNLKLERCAPRVRLPGEATPRQVCNATTARTAYYSTGDGEVRQPVRESGLRALEIASAGFPT